MPSQYQSTINVIPPGDIAWRVVSFYKKSP